MNSSSNGQFNQLFMRCLSHPVRVSQLHSSTSLSMFPPSVVKVHRLPLVKGNNPVTSGQYACEGEDPIHLMSKSTHIWRLKNYFIATFRIARFLFPPSPRRRGYVWHYPLYAIIQMAEILPHKHLVSEVKNAQIITQLTSKTQGQHVTPNFAIQFIAEIPLLTPERGNKKNMKNIRGNGP